MDALRAEVRSLESKIEVLTVKFDTYVDSVKDHEARIRSVERWKLSIPISVLLAIATIVGALVQGKGF